MRTLKMADPMPLTEAEIEAAYAEVADSPTERPECRMDGLTLEELLEMTDDDRR